MSMRSSNTPQNQRMTSGSNRLTSAVTDIHPGYLFCMLLLSAFIGWFAWWFLHNFERVTVTDYALKPAAQYNPYYAAEILINHQHQSENVADDDDNDVAQTLLDSNLKLLLDDLPPLEDVEGTKAQGKHPTLIINDVGNKLTEPRFVKLKTWVEQGGHVITFTSDSSSFDDMQAVLDRLTELQKQQLTAEHISNDQTLQALIDKLDSGNQFLAKLGIFAVQPKTEGDDEDDIEVQIESLIEDLQQQSEKPSISDKDFLENTLEILAEEQPLTLIAPMTLPKDDIRTAQRLAPQNGLMVQSQHRNHHLNTELFRALYPQAAHIHKSQQPSEQAALIRRYLNEQLTRLAVPSAQSDSSQANAPQQDNQPRLPSLKLTRLIKAMLALNDAKLVALFKPADEIFFDSRFGKGRISVLIDNESFANPNPSIDLPQNKSILDHIEDSLNEGNNGDDNSESGLTLTTSLAELLSPSFRITLLSADNAAWLSELTADSSSVWILPNNDVDPLPVMLWKQARVAVLGLGLLSILWLWSLYNRFGKRAQLSTDQAHDIMRYFRQVGRYGWQQDKAAKLTKTTQQQTQQLVKEELKRHLQLTEQSIDNALNTPLKDFDNTALNAINESNAAYIEQLHQMLIQRLKDKQQMVGSAVQDSQEYIGESSSKLTNRSADDSKGLTHNQWLDNDEFIQSIISPARLRLALTSTTRESQQAATYTQITQTLWAIQWLLR